MFHSQNGFSKNALNPAKCASIEHNSTCKSGNKISYDCTPQTCDAEKYFSSRKTVEIKIAKSKIVKISSLYFKFKPSSKCQLLIFQISC